jgi:c-di-GMP-binding flagellar brake protein YcgR
MKTASDASEKRGEQRYRAMERALALMCGSPAELAYHIIDISKSGLAFRYPGAKKPDGAITAIHLCYNDRLCVAEVAVTSVADRWIGSDLTEIRRQSLSFGALSATQRQQLDRFIQLYTLDEPR